MTRMLRRVGVGFTLIALWSVILRAGSSGPKDLYLHQEGFLSPFTHS